MPDTIFQSEPASSEASRLRLMLRTWEAVSTERELPGVLASLADVLVPLVPFDSIGIIDFTVPQQKYLTKTAISTASSPCTSSASLPSTAKRLSNSPHAPTVTHSLLRSPKRARCFLTRKSKKSTNSPGNPIPATISSKKTAGSATSITWQKTASAPTPPCHS